MEKNEKEVWIGESRFYLGEDNTIYVDIVGELDKKTAQDMRDAFYKLLKMIDGKGNVFADNNRSGKPTPEARRIFKIMTEHEKVDKVAVFGMHPVARILATFVVGFSKNKNINIFKSKEEALAWLRE